MAGADVACAKNPLASAYGFSRNVTLWADLFMLFIIPKENNSGKNLIFLRTVLVTLAFQLQGTMQKGCWLCLVCKHGGAPAQDVRNQQAADMRNASDQRAVRDSLGSPGTHLSKFLRPVGLAPGRYIYTDTNAKRTSFWRSRHSHATTPKMLTHR